MSAAVKNRAPQPCRHAANVSFLDAHVWLFEQLGGIPKKLAYDNLKTAVTHVYLGNKRDLTARFLALRSHYLFESRFCNVASGNEEGHVENSVKRSERIYLTPIPHVATLDALDDHLANWTKRDLDRVDATAKLTYGTLLEQERKIFRSLPVTPFMACTSQSLRVDKRSSLISKTTEPAKNPASVQTVEAVTARLLLGRSCRSTTLSQLMR